MKTVVQAVATGSETSGADATGMKADDSARALLMEMVVMHSRSFALAAIERSPANMREAVYIKFPKDVICSEEFGKFDLVSFGYLYKSLCDLTSETTMEQRADKLREDAAAIVKKRMW